MLELLIQNLHVALEGKEILKGIDLDIHKGEFISLLGPSGCGKTTFIKTIAGLLKPDDGDIFLQGQLSNQRVPEKRGTVIVFQDLRLFPNMNVLENVEFGLRMKGIDKKNRQRKALSMLEKVEMAGFENRKIHALSGGQKQRVALARALAAEPSILLLDEPFSSLDESTKGKMIELVLALHQDLKVTTIMVTHNQREALLMSDRIAVMNDGKILQYDTAQKVYEAPLSPEVANYFGKTNYLEGVVKEGYFNCLLGMYKVPLDDGMYQIMIRPENIKVVDQTGDFEVRSISYLGDHTNIVVGNDPINFMINVNSGPIAVGDRLSIDIDFSKSIFFRKE